MCINYLMTLVRSRDLVTDLLTVLKFLTLRPVALLSGGRVYGSISCVLLDQQTGEGTGFEST